MVVPLTDGSATGEEREPTDDLACTAAALVVPAQGILATGESIQAISARLAAA